MDAFYSFLPGFSFLLKALPDLSEVSCQGLLYFFDAVGPFFGLTFNEISQDGAFLIDESADSGIRGAAFLHVLVDHLQGHFLALLCFLSNGSISLEVIIGKFLRDFAELSNPKAYNMLQLTVFITEADYNRFQLLLKIADLTI